MEKKTQETGRWARWISRAYLSLALAAVVLTMIDRRRA